MNKLWSNKVLLFALIYPLWFAYPQADIPLGQWRYHFPLQVGKTLVVGNRQLIYAAEIGIYHFNDQWEGSPLSVLSGLSSNQVLALAYEPDKDAFALAYSNGRIDWLKAKRKGWQIRQIELGNVQPQWERLYVQDGLLYASAQQGVWVIDTERMLLREVWQNIGPSGDATAVYDILVDGTFVWIATTYGVARASINSNLQDYNAWQYFNSGQGLPPGKAYRLSKWQNQVYVLIENQGTYRYEGPSWAPFGLVANTDISDMFADASYLWLSTTDKIYQVDTQGQVTLIEDELFQKLKAIQTDAEGVLYVADGQNGLLSNREGAWRAYLRKGPLYARAQGAAFTQNHISITAGGYDAFFQPTLQPAAFYEFRQGEWYNFATQLHAPQSVPFLYDLVDVIYNPFTREYWYASFGNGLLIRKSNGEFQVIDETSADAPFFGQPAVYITDLHIDRRGNVWVAQFNPPTGNASLHVWQRENNQWRSFMLDASTRRPLEIVEDFNGYLWIRLAGNGGIWVIDPISNAQKVLTAANAQLTNPNIRSLAVDHDGIVWIGSADGVMWVTNPANVFAPDFRVSFPIFGNFQLLNDQVVLQILIDPANRKWMSTTRGVFVFDARLSKQLYYFNSRNSPLPIDQVNQMVLFETTGEMFFITDQGICSFREGVSTASNTFAPLHIFPNPVTPDFQGWIGISGLTRNALVKIVNPNGELIFEGYAAGGTFQWNGKTRQGQSATTGIYFIFATDEQGQLSAMGRLAIIR